MFSGPEMAIAAAAAIILFGSGKIREVARGLGAAKREFSVGQAEADVAAERARAEARAIAEGNVAHTAAVAAPATVNGIVVGAPTTPFEPPAPRN